MNEAPEQRQERAAEPKGRQLSRAVAAKIFRIQGALLGDNPRTEARAKAVLGKLRGAPANPATVDPVAWRLVLGTTGISAKVDDDVLPAELLGGQDTPSVYEKAAYLALTLYSVHQQSQREPMHQAGKPFALAVGQLVHETSSSVKTRFDSLTKAQDATAISRHLRSIITLLRTNGIGFDYGRFADEVKGLLHPGTRQGVLMRWSRDFVSGYQSPRKKEPEGPGTLAS